MSIDLEDFENKVDRFIQAADWAEKFTNGDENLIFSTDSGPKRSFAKVQKDFEDANSNKGISQLTDRTIVVADTSGTNDAAGDINTAISAAAGRKVVIPPGTYLLASSVVINANDVQIDAVGATFVAADGMNDVCLAIYGAAGVHVRGLKIEGNGANQNFVSGETLPCGIVATDVEDLVIEYCELDDFAEHGIQVTSYGGYASNSVLNGNEGPVQNIFIQQNKITGFAYGGVLLQGGASNGTGEAQHGFIRNNWISNSNVSNMSGGGSDVLNIGDGFHHAEVSGNCIYGKGAGVIAIEAHNRPGVRDTEDVRILSNYIRGFNGTPPIVVQHGNNVLRDVVIRGNTLVQSHSTGSPPGYPLIDLNANGVDLAGWAIEANKMYAGSSLSGIAISIQRTSTSGSVELNIRDNDVKEAGWLFLQTNGPATNLKVIGGRTSGRRGVVGTGLGNVSIHGLEFLGNGGSDGIKLIGCTEVEVSECRLRNARIGVRLIDCDLVRVVGNIIREHNRHGIVLSEKDDTDMHGAVVSGNVVQTTESTNSNAIGFYEDHSGRIDYYLLTHNMVSISDGKTISTGFVTGGNGKKSDNIVY